VKALIICHPDGFANGVKPGKLAEYLRTKGCEVGIYSTTYLSRAGKTGLAAHLPGPTPKHLALYLVEAVAFVAGLLGKLQRGTSRTLTRYSVMIKQVMQLRGAILRANLAHHDYDMIICESGCDIAFLAGKRLARTQILDLPSPGAEEIYFGGQISCRGYRKLRGYEAALYAKADHIGFHWPSYTAYVKNAKYDGPNFIDLSYGVDLPATRASFKTQPHIVFMGLLSSYWINLPLLIRLCKIYPHIDIYGGPRLAELGDNYKGYSPTTDVLAGYQFGLITLSDDPLRRNGFSSKQLRYYSYGLPVLSPNWHCDSALDEAALLYDEKNFLHLIHEYSEQQKWTELSTKALKIAQHYDWEKVLRPLDALLPPAWAAGTDGAERAAERGGGLDAENTKIGGAAMRPHHPPRGRP
jgi:hypothetical protein